MQILAFPPVDQMEPVHHRGENRIALRFPHDQALIREVKALPDAQWSAKLMCWHVMGTAVSKQIFDESSLPVRRVDRPACNKINVQEPTIITSPQQTGTTVGVPTPGVISGISSQKEEPSALPQPDTQGATDISVLSEQRTQEIKELLGPKFLKTTLT